MICLSGFCKKKKKKGGGKITNIKEFLLLPGKQLAKCKYMCTKIEDPTGSILIRLISL